MGITIHYTFLPADLDPTAEPMAAHRLMSQAADIVAPTLRQAGIPCRLPPPVINETEYYQAVIAEGPGEGSEWLLLGWNRLYASQPWSGDQFVKTQYARDFGLTHMAFCEALLRLTAAGLVDPDIFDEGNYLPDRNPEALGRNHHEMAATLGAIDDLLQAIKLPHIAATPGGNEYRFVPERPGQVTAAELDTAQRRFHQAGRNICQMSREA